MDKPINGDKYIRTLSHYLRHNQRRLVPTIDKDSNINANGSNNTSVGQSARSIVTPSDPMAAAYSGMVNSLWSISSAVVNTITPSAHSPPSSAQDRDSYSGAWDGTGSIPADTNPRERQLYLQAQLKAPILPLDLYYLLYLLDRFELAGIEIEGWDGSTPRAVGDSNPRVLNTSTGTGTGQGEPNSSTYSSFPPPTGSTRPQSIRSFSSTALSTLTLITGWKQWSNAASTNSGITIEDDVHFIHKLLKSIAGLRLVAKISPGLDDVGKGRIEGYSADAISNLFNQAQSHELASSSRQQQQLLLPLAATFSSLTHLELHKIPPRSIEGWETLMIQLKSLVIIQANIEDVYDVIVAAVVESERRRRRRVSKEKNRAVLIRQEQREALKDATLIAKGRRLGAGSGSSSMSSSSSAMSSPESSHPSSPSQSPTLGQDSYSEDEQAILRSIKMWPVLRHLSVSENALPTLQQTDTFLHAQAIVSLDLSHNLLISPPHGLIHLHNLHSLNMSYNMIESVQAIYQILGNIAVLDLRGNRLQSLCGLERLWNLEKIDVRDNQLEEAAEVGRLAALPGIREIWAECNPLCTKQPKYRLEILAVFKANGHDLLLDGTFASILEKRSLANMSPTAFSTTISSINNVNLANIPAASAPTATLAKGLASPPPRITRPSTASTTAETQEERVRTEGSNNSSCYPKTTKADHLNAVSPSGSISGVPAKLVKKKLVKSSKRVKRVVNLDSDHDDEEDDHHYHHHHHPDTEESSSILGPPVEIAKKKKTKKVATTAEDTNAHEDGEKKMKKKKAVKKKKSQGPVSFAGDDLTSGNVIQQQHHDGDENHHVHRLAQLEESMATLQVHTHRHSSDNESGGDQPTSPSQHDDEQHLHPSRSVLKKSISGGFDGHRRNRPSSPKVGSTSLDYSSDEGGAEGYRRKIEAMRNEAGINWLKVLAEMDSETQARKDSEGGQSR
ncbi:hypothetical protein BGX28_006582 [Mortierella sp. GBA30]|nr:hypothetical protein BGX28_006582 [Mortierella sp. GBA30]